MIMQEWNFIGDGVECENYSTDERGEINRGIHPYVTVANHTLEKSHRFLIVRDEHVLCLTIMIEHHQVVFAAEA